MLFLILLPLFAAAVPQLDLSLTISVFDAGNMPVSEASVLVENRGEGLQWTLTTPETGVVRLDRLSSGAYNIRVSKDGFFDAETEIRLETSRIVEFTLASARGGSDAVQVVARQEAIDTEAVGIERNVSQQAIQNIPFTGRRDFRNALTLTPGVLRDNAGRMHIQGSDSSQVRYRLDGMDLTSAESGDLAANIPIDAIESVDLALSGYSAEFGRASGGIVQIRSQFIQDEFRLNLTDFIPGVNFRRKTIGEFSPRLTASGLVVRNRLWFMYAASARYTDTYKEDLPEGANRQVHSATDQLLKLQWNPRQSHVLTFNLLHNSAYYGNMGLSPTRPLETTTNAVRTGTSTALSHRAPWGSTLLETVLQWNRSDDSNVAKGDQPYVSAPAGWSGNFNEDRRGRTQRLQIAHTAAREVEWGDTTHLLKAGVEWESVDSRMRIDRRPIEFRNDAGLVHTQIRFEGSNHAHASNRYYGVFVQDRVALGRKFQIEIGIRAEREDITKQIAAAPRIAFAFLPRGSSGSRIAGGIGVFYDTVRLDHLLYPRLQHRLSTSVDAAGALAASAAVPVDLAPRLRNPRGIHWNLSWEQEWAPQWVTRVNYVDKRDRDVVRIQAIGAADALRLQVDNSGAARYRGIEVSLDRPINTRLRVALSYTYSAASRRPSQTLEFPDPRLEEVSGAPADWDVPHRFLAWGYFPFLFESNAAFSVEARSGFPFTVVGDLNRFQGAYNGRRLPAHVHTSLSVGREIPFLLGKRVEVRVSITNLFNRFNPRSVDANMLSPTFMQFSDSSGRAFSGRLRLIQ